VNDVLVPELDEVANGEARAERLIGLDAVDGVAAQHAGDDHDGRRRGRGCDVAGWHGRADEDDPVRPVFEQRVEHLALAPPLPAPGRQQDAVVQLGGQLLDARRDLGVERVVKVAEHDAEGLSPAVGQAARHGIRSVAELGGRGEHPLVSLLADLGAVADDERRERP